RNGLNNCSNDVLIPLIEVFDTDLCHSQLCLCLVDERKNCSAEYKILTCLLHQSIVLQKCECICVCMCVCVCVVVCVYVFGVGMVARDTYSVCLWYRACVFDV